MPAKNATQMVRHYATLPLRLWSYKWRRCHFALLISPNGLVYSAATEGSSGRIPGKCGPPLAGNGHQAWPEKSGLLPQLSIDARLMHPPSPLAASRLSAHGVARAMRLPCAPRDSSTLSTQRVNPHAHPFQDHLYLHRRSPRPRHLLAAADRRSLHRFR